MRIDNRQAGKAQSASLPNQRDGVDENPAAPMVLPPRIGKSGEVGCAFAGLIVQMGDRSPDDYAAFLEDL